ncbi:NOV protein, partial [Polyodon spathula]|nr:NOV protein [Polyodon spathula]
MLDDCACCLVCGRQQGEACSERNPCDTRKALRCDYSADPRKTVGVCMVQLISAQLEWLAYQVKPEFTRRAQNQPFITVGADAIQATMVYTWCVIMLKSSYTQNAALCVTCCKRLHATYCTIFIELQHAREGDICVFDGSVYQNGETFQPSCKYQCACRDGQIGCVPRCNLDVLLPGPDCPIPRKVQVPGECCEKWVCDSKAESPLGGFAMAGEQEDTYGVDIFDPSINCIEQTTEWGACSKSCGMGVSTRVTNRNRRCEMGKQNRLCIVRPCEKEHQKQTSKKGKKCFRTKKTVKPTHFEFKNCTSVHAYKPRYCGVCSDGRCCTPHSTKTVQVEFQCPRGKTIKKTMMFINTCACHNNCPRDNAVFQMSDPMFSGFKI